MKYIGLLSILLMQTCEIFSQNDTILYFSKLGRVNENKENASYYIEIKRLNENSFIQTKKPIDKTFAYEEQLEINKINDSTYSISSVDPKYSFLRGYSKTDSGYIVKEIRRTRVEAGFSKLVFPLIKSGVWYTYEDSNKITEEYFINNEVVENKYWNDDGSFISNVFVTTETPIGYDEGDINKASRSVVKYLKYPKEARKNGIQGRVIVQFVVMEGGTVDRFKILREVDESLDNEAIRAIKAMPAKWIPGTIKGKAVRAFAVLPIVFRLE